MTDALPTLEFLDQEYDPEYPVDQLTPHPANPNQGDQGLLSEVLTANGFAGTLLVQKSTGIIIDGETRYHVARAHGATTLPVMLVDCDDDTRERFLAEWNQTTRAGTNDLAKLVDLLKGLAGTPKGLAGAAFDGDDLDAMIIRLNPPPPEDFKDYDDNIPTAYRCPSCGYEWSGKPGGGQDGGEDGE